MPTPAFMNSALRRVAAGSDHEDSSSPYEVEKSRGTSASEVEATVVSHLRNGSLAWLSGERCAVQPGWRTASGTRWRQALALEEPSCQRSTCVCAWECHAHVHVHAHGACARPRGMCMSMGHVRVHVHVHVTHTREAPELSGDVASDTSDGLDVEHGFHTRRTARRVAD